MNHITDIKIVPCERNFDYMLTFTVPHLLTKPEYVGIQLSGDDLDRFKEAIEVVRK